MSQTLRHTCHWPGCPVEVPRALWGCRQHWWRLPANLRRRIWAAYVPGQETSGRPSPDYIEAARAVRTWILSEQARREAVK